MNASLSFMAGVLIASLPAVSLLCLGSSCRLSQPHVVRSSRLRAVEFQTERDTATGTFTGRPGGGFEVLDVEAMRAASTFPIAPDDLIFRCQEVLAANVGTKDPSMLADEFEFAGPVVGPINKEQARTKRSVCSIPHLALTLALTLALAPVALALVST